MAEAALALASVVVFLLLAEAALRVVGLADERPTGYAPVNTRRRDRRPTNSLGYRDVERALAEARGGASRGLARRLLRVGRRRRARGHVRPARRARSRRRPGERWEVVQLARPGMDTVEQAEQLAEEGFAYEPDLVVLGYC